MTFPWVLVFLHLALTKYPALLPHLPPSLAPSILPSIHQPSVSGTTSLSQNALAQLLCDSPPSCALLPSQLIKPPHAHPSSPSSITVSSLMKPSPTSSAKTSSFLLCVPRARCVFIPLFSTYQSKGSGSHLPRIKSQLCPLLPVFPLLLCVSVVLSIKWEQ